MKKVLCLILWFISIHSIAGVPSNTSACQGVIDQTIEKWKPVGAWQSFILGGEEPLKGFRIKSTQIGRWIEFIPGHKGVGAAKLISPGQDLIVTWRNSDCRATPKIFQKDLKNYYQLMALLKDKKMGVIYMWSPHMAPSIYGLKQIIEATKKLGIPLIPVLHPESSTKAAIAVLDKHQLNRNFATIVRDQELSLLNLNQHPPSLAVFRENQWVGKVLPGAENAKTYSEFIKYALSQNP